VPDHRGELLCSRINIGGLKWDKHEVVKRAYFGGYLVDLFRRQFRRPITTHDVPKQKPPSANGLEGLPSLTDEVSIGFGFYTQGLHTLGMRCPLAGLELRLVPSALEFEFLALTLVSQPRETEREHCEEGGHGTKGVSDLA